MRVGGLDILWHWFERQTFQDFELVIADGLYSWRKGAVPKHQRLQHVEPFDNPFPTNAFCRYANTALAYARGVIAIFITDYTWLPPDGVEKHATFHVQPHTDRHGLMCPHRYAALLPRKTSFPKYQYQHDQLWPNVDNDVELDRYVADIRSGALDDCKWSIFDRNFDSDARQLPRDPIWGEGDPKLTCAAGPIGATNFHGKNESCRLGRAIEINGWDEDLDGSHVWQDSDFSERLEQKAGVSWMVDPTNVAIIVNPRPFFPYGRRLRPFPDNERIWQTKRDGGYAHPVNSWSIADRRKQIENQSRYPAQRVSAG